MSEIFLRKRVWRVCSFENVSRHVEKVDIGYGTHIMSILESLLVTDGKW